MEIAELINSTELVTLDVTARHGFVAPTGYGIVSVDLRNQEMRKAAILSGEEKWLRALLEEPTELPLLDEDGNPIYKDGKQVFYPNPDADLHTISAAMCCFPHLFEGKPKWMWDTIARDKSLIPQKGCCRDYGKRLNFELIYLATAQSIAQLNFVTEQTATQWIKLHQKVYHQFHAWAQEIAGLSVARGWNRTELGRIRWVAEDNAKAAGASPARSGVNMSVQGASADEAKLALWYILSEFEYTTTNQTLLYKYLIDEGYDPADAYRLASKPRFLNQLVHDEVVCTLPGQLQLDTSRVVYKDGKLKPKYAPDQELIINAEVVKYYMELGQYEMASGLYKGMAAYEIAPYWSH